MFFQRIVTHRTAAAVGLLLACALALAASAVVLNPSDVFAVFGTTAAAQPAIAGALAHDQVRPFEIRSAGGVLLYSANLHSWVRYSNITGKAVFYHRIEPGAQYGLTGIVDHLLIRGSYAGFTTDANYRTDLGAAGHVGLATISRNAAPGSSVRPVFAAGGVPNRAWSRWIFVLTNANGFALGTGNTWIVLTTGESAMVLTPGPV